MRKIEGQKAPTEKTHRVGVRFIGKEKDTFFENFAMLIASNMNVEQALIALGNDVRSRMLKKIIDELRLNIDAGKPLWEGLQQTGIVTPNAISLIKIGEQSGRLSQNLNVVIEQRLKNKLFKSRLRSAMMYPVLVLTLAFTIAIGIAWFILPKLSTVFLQLNVELPTMTRALIWFGEFLGSYGKIVVPASIIGLIFLLYIIFGMPKTKIVGQKLLFSTPIIKQLVKQIEVARFGFILGMLLDAGVPILDAVRSLRDATNLYMYKRFYTYLEKSIGEGKSFNTSFQTYKKSSKLIPIPVQHLIYSAEQSGTLSKTLQTLGKTYDDKIETTTKNLTVLLEPLMLVIVWLGVVFVAISVILPIYSLIGGFNTEGQVPQSSKDKPVERTVDVNQEPTVPVESEQSATTTVSNEPLYDVPTLQIRETGVGYLNVRSGPSLDEPIVTRVFPGDEYVFTDTADGWYRIILESSETGWVTEEFIDVLYDGA